MQLETHEGPVPGPVTADSIAETVAGLVEVGKAFVIMSGHPDDETYVQASGTVGEKFIVERRDGCAGEHYRGDHCVGADDLVTLLVGYLHSAPDWSHTITWHRIRVDQDAIEA